MDEQILARKLKLWQNKLLDLSKRNRMISFKDGSMQVIRFVEPGFEELYKKLVVDKASLLIKKPIDRVADPVLFALMRLMQNLGEDFEVSWGDIRTSATLERSEKIVKNIRKYANLSLQEKGTNILYLSFGFVYWRDQSTNGVWLKAPLVLVPVELTQTSVYSPFSVQRTEEDIIVNPTFAYYVEANHGIQLPHLDSTNSVEEILKYFHQVSVTIEKLGWRVESEVYLSTLSFLKTNMYNDLVDNEALILAHPVIRALAGEQSQSTTLDESTTDFKHDNADVEHVYEVLNADSSQKDAIELSHRGISFVMQGPPGTGKSQTITNIIAQGIADGKKILFVSEKQAALDVVYNRLRDVGLNSLCLPLHNPKTNKKVVIDELASNLDAPNLTVKNSAMSELHQLDELKKELDLYSNRLHVNREPLNMSIYEAYQMLFALDDIPDVVNTFTDISSISRSDMNRMIREVSEYEEVRDGLGGDWYSHPWSGVKKQILSSMSKQRLKESMTDLLLFLKKFCEYQITPSKRLSEVITWNNIHDYMAIGKLIASKSVVPKEKVLNDKRSDLLSIPSDILSLVKSVSDFFKKDSNAIVEELDDIRSLCVEAYSLFDTLSDLLDDSLIKKISCLQLFQLQTLIGQFELGINDLSITPSYFSDNVISNVDSIIEERKKSFERMNVIQRSIECNYDREVLTLDLKISSEEELLDLIDSIYATDVKDIDFISNVLLKKYNITLLNKSNPDEVISVIKALLEGDFDCFVNLSDNEFYFVYDLFEEAQQKTNLGDLNWFKDFGNIFQQYIGKNPLEDSINWEDYLILANDFYYVKNSYRELIELAKLSKNDKSTLCDELVINNNSSYEVDGLLDDIRKHILLNKIQDLDSICRTIRDIFEYQSIKKTIDDSYANDVSVLGNKYLKDSTSWDIIESNINFVKELKLLFDDSAIDGISELVCKAGSIKWNAVNIIANKLYTIGLKLIVIKDLTIESAKQMISSNLKTIDEIISKRGVWREECDIIEVIRNNVYKNNQLVFDIDVLELMLSDDSKCLFDLLDSICELEDKAEALNLYFDSFEEPNLLMNLTISNLYVRLNACVNRFSEYDTMVEYQICFNHCIKDGLSSFITKAYQVRKEEGTLGKILEKSFLYSWIDYVSKTEECISAFSSRVQNNRIDSFKKLDARQLKIACERVLAYSYDNMPKRSAGRVVGELGILLREISKAGNIMSIRKLFNNIPNLLLTLKPCLMMSPLSVAYFLNAESFCFDMVIFDEASQIFPENAVGAILRGKQVIISGDSKQMPPTNFFRTFVESQDDDEEDLVINGDSILEEMENCLPNLSLTWHYRSRNESLITFSNRNMYSGSLVTFPNNAPNVQDSGVELISVENGVFENRCNEAEANRCVSLAIEHFVKHPDRSLGIIAFSVAQEECIERAFDIFRMNNHQYEAFFSETSENPFFIKNLENVQGDERDTIILSVGYGKNERGILRYNFGPLGMHGGERRMNVAITRAKHNIKLVTSLRPVDFDPSRTKENSGAKLLYDYISYAMHGVAPDLNHDVVVTNDGFKQYIVNVLENEGYRIVNNVGNSGYKVEIAVEHPDKPGNYILGIETDGHEYRLARTVRDRESLRPSILQSMGWNIYRVWSAQWIRDPEMEKKKLLDYISQLISDDRANIAE